jgi:hypothetical protein
LSVSPNKKTSGIDLLHHDDKLDAVDKFEEELICELHIINGEQIPENCDIIL